MRNWKPTFRKRPKQTKFAIELLMDVVGLQYRDSPNGAHRCYKNSVSVSSFSLKEKRIEKNQQEGYF